MRVDYQVKPSSPRSEEGEDDEEAAPAQPVSVVFPACFLIHKYGSIDVAHE